MLNLQLIAAIFHHLVYIILPSMHRMKDKDESQQELMALVENDSWQAAGESVPDLQVKAR